MQWQLILILGLFLSSTATIIQKTIHKQPDSDPIAFAVFFQFLLGIIIGVFGLLINEFTVSNFRGLIPNLVLMSFLYGFGNVAFFASLKKAETSFYSIIANTSALFTIITSMFVFRLALSGQQALGVLLILFSLIFVNWHGGKLQIGRTELLALFGAFCFGAEVTNDKTILTGFSVYAFLFVASVLPALLMAVIFHKKIPKMRYFVSRKTLPRFSVFIAVYAAQAIAYFLALKAADNPAQFGGIALCGSIITVFMSIIFLRERKSLPKKIIGIAISVLGLALLG